MDLNNRPREVITQHVLEHLKIDPLVNQTDCCLHAVISYLDALYDAGELWVQQCPDGKEEGCLVLHTTTSKSSNCLHHSCAGVTCQSCEERFIGTGENKDGSVFYLCNHRSCGFPTNRDSKPKE